MEIIDLTILEKKPKLDKKATLIIEPLAPLSMVDDLPGSFYKSLKSPSKKMLCGLFENILGWHISIEQRSLIQKELIKLRKKQKIDFSKQQKGSTYIPLLMEYFDIELVTIPPIFHYNDLWSRSFTRRNDSFKHAAASMYFNHSFIKKWRKIVNTIKNDEKRSSSQKNALLDRLFKRYNTNFPLYYTTPTKREFIQYHDNIEIILKLDKELFVELSRGIKTNNHSYLGNSEGWINLKIKTV